MNMRLRRQNAETLELSRSDERKATLKRAASRTLGTVTRALEEVNAAIAESVYGQAGFAGLSVSVAREV